MNAKDDVQISLLPTRAPMIRAAGDAAILDWSGKPLEILCESEHTCGLYTVQRATVHTGEGPIVGHVHSFGESFYLLSGRAEFFLKSYRLSLVRAISSISREERPIALKP